MRKALYLVTRDSYLACGLKKTFSDVHFQGLALETLAPQDFHQISTANGRYDLIYLMADADIRRFVKFHYPQLNITEVPARCRPEELIDFLRQNTRQQAALRDHEVYMEKPASLFSRREEEILRYLQKGMAPSDIARQIQRSEKTVSHYKRLIMEKTGCKSHIQLIELLHSSPVA
ncbi:MULTISPECIES: helix-turn-helix transcriptional regulator [Tenebrionibacter/Tenebrionicola group]|jgi:DNA-binding CsgD family transcriptional regulator|uniref:Response regulator transcription factor n=2 Tax=Tenebrionibacter/Tenebrionicola group TaxID=2969848 RepID=A0A8K0V328_9ENTR|nr:MULTISPECIES: LuxR C-terminal-related transcriptional regulator [Tenebrionibacter/Tenebrionicola group]MBK4714711.1 response regulator transcription factor [Tenebrionibacter intestinalis]MBV4413865.1 response regulator transcription factor [Tenebrionicola larvae]MBV5095181.1 response regulator transcription factor [Tenebrionicola larvae]